jgi:hypothetical protein
MPASLSRYCIVLVHYADRPGGSGQPLCVEGKVVIFDTLEQARDVVPRLGGARMEAWDRDREVIYFTPLVRTGFNKLTIATGYDPYDVPNGWRAMGVYSEAAGRDWRHHCHIWGEVDAGKVRVSIVAALEEFGNVNALAAFPEGQEGYSQNAQAAMDRMLAQGR